MDCHVRLFLRILALLMFSSAYARLGHFYYIELPFLEPPLSNQQSYPRDVQALSAGSAPALTFVVGIAQRWLEIE